MPEAPVRQRAGDWGITDRRLLWNTLGARVFDDHLDRISAAAVKVFRELQPHLDLEPEARLAASFRGGAPRHSHSLRKGLAETLALLATSSEALTSCSGGKAEHTAAQAVHEILRDADWSLWASLNDQLPLLAEAAPEVFVRATERALGESPCPFGEMFQHERSGIMGSNHMTGLLWALEALAWSPDYLSRVTVLLGELAAIDPGGNWTNRPSNSLITIFLPWHPQTCASILQRRVALSTLLREQPAVGWKVLLELLPKAHSSTMGSHKPVWRKFIPEDWPESVTHSDYWEQVKGYADLLVQMALREPTRLPELIGCFPLPEPAHQRVLDHLQSAAAAAEPEPWQLSAWESLASVATRHRHHAGAPWAMSAKAVEECERVAALLAPSPPQLRFRRLFNDYDGYLFEGGGDYDQRRAVLRTQRGAAIQEIRSLGGLPLVLEFAAEVKFPGAVGEALAQIADHATDGALLPDLLASIDPARRDCICEYIWGRFASGKWDWVDGISMTAWTSDQKVVFFALLPFGCDVWRRAEASLGADAHRYWKAVTARPLGPQQPHLVEAVERLNSNGRPRAALRCVDRLIWAKEEVPANLVESVLLAAVASEESPHEIDHHSLLQIIEWLQGQPTADADALMKIEWAHLPLLDQSVGGSPKTLQRRLATDPDFFCELLKVSYRSVETVAEPEEPDDAHKAMAMNTYQLLSCFRTTPGRTADGHFDVAAFNQWLDAVIQQTRSSGHLRMAMVHIGHMLAYAPPDPAGLWIHRAVAEVLNTRDAGDMRSAFSCELFNMRGARSYTGGREEGDLAKQYALKADELEASGYQRLASSIRQLAKGYERDAKPESERDSQRP